MANLVYLEELIDEFSAFLCGIATGTVLLQSGHKNLDKYDRYRKRILRLKPLIGEPPKFLREATDGWKFWEFIKTGRATYDERRTYIGERFTKRYKDRIAGIPMQSLEEALLSRDLLIEMEIGRGGFGTVYCATQLSLNAPRAVKIFDPSFYGGEDQPLRRFAREAELLSKISHKSIVRFYDAGIVSNTPFIVMEMVDGINLQKYCSENGNFSANDAAKTCRSILLALRTAHNAGIFHRDIKPVNVMKCGDGIRVLDFGAGIAIEHALSTRMTTRAIGTSGYVAPELYGDPALLAPGPDIYSVGALAHYILTGCLPYAGDTSRYLREHGVPDGLIAIVRKALNPPPSRYEAAIEMADELKEFLDGQ